MTDNDSGPFSGDEHGWNALFAAIDARDAAAFAAFLTPQAEFRFGNSPPVVGREAIQAAVAGFFAMLQACRHRVRHTWSGAGTVACEGVVTYTVPGGAEVAVPFANVFELDAGRIAGYRIYIDNAPLYAALG